MMTYKRLTRTIPPKSGPVSQGLNISYNTGKTIEFRTDDVTFMYAGDVYGEFVYDFSNFKMQKGKYELLKSEWKDAKLGEIIVLRLIGEVHVPAK